MYIESPRCESAALPNGQYIVNKQRQRRELTKRATASSRLKSTRSSSHLFACLFSCLATCLSTAPAAADSGCGSGARWSKLRGVAKRIEQQETRTAARRSYCMRHYLMRNSDYKPREDDASRE